MNIPILNIKDIINKSTNYIGDNYIFHLDDESNEKLKNIYELLLNNTTSTNVFHIYIKLSPIYFGNYDWGYITICKDDLANTYMIDIIDETVELHILSVSNHDTFKDFTPHQKTNINICDTLNEIEQYINDILLNKEDYKSTINSEFPYELRKGYIDRATFNNMFRKDVSRDSYIIGKNEELANIIKNSSTVYYDRMDFETYMKVYCECVRIIYKIDAKDEDIINRNFAITEIDKSLMNNEQYFAIKYNELIGYKFTHIIYTAICLWADYEKGKWKLTLDIRKPYYLNYGIRVYEKLKDKLNLSNKHMYVNALLNIDNIIVGNHEQLLIYDKDDEKMESMIVPLDLIEPEDILTDDIKHEVNWYEIDDLNDID